MSTQETLRAPAFRRFFPHMSTHVGRGLAAARENTSRKSPHSSAVPYTTNRNTTNRNSAHSASRRKPLFLNTHNETSHNETSHNETSSYFANRGGRFLERLQLPLLLVLCAAFAWRPLMGGDDFWAHAAVGRWSWNHAQVPTRSLFLWSADEPWVAHSWLSQLFFYGLMAVGDGLSFRGHRLGPYVVQAFTLLMALLPFVLLWKLWARQARQSSLFKPLLFALAIFASSLRFHPRPELFTACFWTLLLWFLVDWPQEFRAQENRGIASCCGLLLVFWVWANCHGAVALGLVLLGVSSVCELAQERFSWRAWCLAGVVVACAGVTLLNPFGVALWRDVVRSSGSAMFSRIDEWQPPLRSPLLWSYAMGEAVLVLAAIFAWRRNPQRRWSQIAWLLLMSVLFLRQRRHLWLLALIALAVMAANARGFDEVKSGARWRRKMPQLEETENESSRAKVPNSLWTQSDLMMRLAVTGILIVAIAAALPPASSFRSVASPLRSVASSHTPRVSSWPFAVSPLVPEDAASWIERNWTKDSARGHIFNDYENSSYLQWRLNGASTKGAQVSSRGRFPLSIDLLNAYPQRVVDEYVQIINATPEGRRLLQTHAVGCVVLSGKRDSPLARFLDHSSDWRRAYNAADGVIWQRTMPMNKTMPLNTRTRRPT